MFDPPGSRLWPAAGILRLGAGAMALFGLVWLLAVWASGGRLAANAADVPLLGPGPIEQYWNRTK